MLQINVIKLWLFGFVGLIFFLPISVGSIKLLNEPILSAATILSVGLVWFYRNSISKFSYSIFLICAVFSAFFLTILVLNIPPDFVFKDFVECFKPIIYALIFVSGVLLSTRFTEDDVVHFIIFSGICSVAFSYLVFFPPAYSFIDIYKARQSVESNSFHFYRFSGTLGFPGGFGYWVVLVLQVALLQLYRQKITSFWFFLLYTFLLSGLVFSGSRGAFAVYLIVNFVTIILLPSKKITWLMAVTLIGGVTGFGMFLLVSEVELQAILHFQKVLENPTGGTFAHRASELERLFESISQGYVIGHGPNNKFIQNTYGPVESVYYFYGYKFGLIGLTYYFIWVGFVAYMLLKIFLSGRKVNFTFFFCLWAIVNMIVAGVSNSITEEYKSFFMFFLLLGYVSGKLKTL